jgi:formylglycine-generating enzyme required for sulfatase activity
MMSPILRTVAALFLVLGPTLLSGQGLTPSVQAELLRDKIVSQAKANDADGVLKSLDQYHKLVDDNKLTFPPPLYLIEAKAAHDAGDANRALSALTEFLNKSEADSSGHKEALALYPQYQQSSASAYKLSEDARLQALSARIPEVLAQINASVVAVTGGRITCSKIGPSVTWSITGTGPFNPEPQRPTVYGNGPNICGPIEESTVESFDVMNRCVPNLWWDVYVVDTGKASTYDGWAGSDDCAGALVWAAFLQGQNKDRSIALSDIANFITWVSAKTGKLWRLPRESELALMYQKAVHAGSVWPHDTVTDYQGVFSTWNLGAHFKRTQVLIDPHTGRVHSDVTGSSGPMWELTEDCASPGGAGSLAGTSGDDLGSPCKGSGLAVITLLSERTETINFFKVKYDDVKTVYTESTALVVARYPNTPRDSVDNTYVAFRLVRE